MRVFDVLREESHRGKNNLPTRAKSHVGIDLQPLTGRRSPTLENLVNRRSSLQNDEPMENVLKTPVTRGVLHSADGSSSWPLKSAACERRHPFFHERPRGLLMIFGATGFDLMPCLEVEKLSESPALRCVKILLHQGECDPRAAGQLSREQHRDLDQIGIRNHPIDHSECQGLRRIKRLSRVVEFARLARADKLGEKITARQSHRKIRYWRKPSRSAPIARRCADRRQAPAISLRRLRVRSP